MNKTKKELEKMVEVGKAEFRGADSNPKQYCKVGDKFYFLSQEGYYIFMGARKSNAK